MNQLGKMLKKSIDVFDTTTEYQELINKLFETNPNFEEVKQLEKCLANIVDNRKNTDKKDRQLWKSFERNFGFSQRSKWLYPDWYWDENNKEKSK